MDGIGPPPAAIADRVKAARGAQARRNFADAVRDFRQAVAEAPAWPGGWLLLARALWQAGDAAAGRQCLRAAAVAFPDLGGVWAETALLARASGDLDASARAGERLARVRPDSGAGFLIAGHALHRQGAGDRAVGLVRRAVAAADQPAAPALLAQLLHLAGRWGEVADPVFGVPVADDATAADFRGFLDAARDRLPPAGDRPLVVTPLPAGPRADVLAETVWRLTRLFPPERFEIVALVPRHVGVPGELWHWLSEGLTVVPITDTRLAAVSGVRAGWFRTGDVLWALGGEAGLARAWLRHFQGGGMPAPLVLPAAAEEAGRAAAGVVGLPAEPFLLIDAPLPEGTETDLPVVDWPALASAAAGQSPWLGPWLVARARLVVRSGDGVARLAGPLGTPVLWRDTPMTGTVLPAPGDRLAFAPVVGDDGAPVRFRARAIGAPGTPRALTGAELSRALASALAAEDPPTGARDRIFAAVCADLDRRLRDDRVQAAAGRDWFGGAAPWARLAAADDESFPHPDLTEPAP